MRVTASHVQEQLSFFRKALELVKAPINKYPFFTQLALLAGLNNRSPILL